MRGTLERHTWVFDGTGDVSPKFRRSCRYESFTPWLLAGFDLRLPADIAAGVAEAEAAIVRLDARADPALDPLARLLLRTEAIASSRIEDMQVEVRALARAEAKYDLGGSIGSEALEILRSVEAMQLAVDSVEAAPTITSELIRELHAALMQSAPPWTKAGEYRTAQNWIGGNNFNPCGAAFVPPPPDAVGPLMADLCEFANSELVSPIVQAAVAHAQFETIHPFNDGNGRTGRALIHAILGRRGVARQFVAPVSVVLGQRRDRYIEGLTAFRADELESWIEHFAFAAAKAARLSSEYLDSVSALRESWRAELAASPRAPRADSVAWKLIEVLPSQLVLTGSAAVSATGGAKPRVNQAIELLVECGVLRPVTSGARNRAWEPVGLIDIVEELERGQ
ncbi:MAG: hypothetical protein JWM25_135 [Thermoleophilia bacterium]|nr:hypothetical protein [Thermoleophilia bacterium]